MFNIFNKKKQYVKAEQIFENKILIVDDADINRYILKKFIEKLNLNFSIEEAKNGLEAIDKCSKTNYNYIFMDLKMPGIDGIDASIKILKENPNTNIIGCTGQIEKDIIDKCLKIGMKKCIGKPIQLSSLTFLTNI